MYKTPADLCLWCMSPTEDKKCSSPTCCGKNKNFYNSSTILPPKTMLENRYYVGAVIATLPYGFIYSAFDTEEEEKLWLYEFFEPALATRSGIHVLPRSKKEIEYKTMLATVESAYRKLTAFTFKECFAPVRRVFRENGTVYSAIHMVEGSNLNTYLTERGGEIDWNDFKKPFLALCSTVSRLNREGEIISPLSSDELYISNENKFYLRSLSFADHLEALQPLPKAYFGTAAPEFYEKSACITPAADIYTLAALAYRALTGTMPPDAQSRMVVDNLRPPAELEPQIPAQVSAAITASLSIAPADRPKSIENFTALLLEDVSSNTAVFTDDILPKTPSANAGNQDAPTKKRLNPLVFIAIFALAAAVGAMYLFLGKNTGLPNFEGESSSLAPLPEPRYVPSLEGRYLSSVDQSDYNEQFNFSIRRTFSDSYPEGVIISQMPPSGVKMLHKGTIILTVSVGSQTTPMPNLVGSSLSFATQTMTDNKFTYRIEETDEGENPKIVYKTSIPAGQEVDRSNTTVVIYVGRAAMSSSQSSAESSSPEASSSSQSSSSLPESSWTSASEIDNR